MLATLVITILFDTLCDWALPPFRVLFRFRALLIINTHFCYWFTMPFWNLSKHKNFENHCFSLTSQCISPYLRTTHVTCLNDKAYCYYPVGQLYICQSVSQQITLEGRVNSTDKEKPSNVLLRLFLCKCVLWNRNATFLTFYFTQLIHLDFDILMPFSYHIRANCFSYVFCFHPFFVQKPPKPRLTASVSVRFHSTLPRHPATTNK